MTPDKITRNNEDRDLLARVAQADERAFSDLYDRYSRVCYSLAYRILNDSRETEDAVQEGFVQMWKRAATYDGTRSSVFSWLVMIIRHKAIDRLRARASRSNAMDAMQIEVEHAATDHYEAFDENIDLHERRTILKQALVQIPEEQREAINLAFFSGLTQQQISEKLGEPLGTVKARIRRGLLRLRDQLKGGAL